MKQYKYGTYGAIAKRDLKDMEFLLKKKKISYLAVLSAHHSIESILKHYINEYYIGLDKLDILKLHHLNSLSNKSSIPALSLYSDTLDILTDFYDRSRYPNPNYYEPTMNDLEPLLQDIYNIFQIVENYISNISIKKVKLCDIIKEVQNGKIKS